MKKTLTSALTLIFILFLCFLNISIAEVSQIQNFKSKIVKDKDGKVQKYSILVTSSVDLPHQYSERYISRVDDKYYQKGKIYIKTKNKTDNGKSNLLQATSSLKNHLASIGATKISTFSSYQEINKFPEMKKYGFDRIYSIQIPFEKDPLDVCAELMENPEIEYACPEYIMYSNKHRPNDPDLYKQFSIGLLKLQEAWDITKGSPNIKIAIIDSGTDYNHEDLAGNIWTNPNETPGNNIDDDNNGKVDDVIGWDFVGSPTYEQLVNGKFTEDNDPINLINTHGTSTAGCASSVTNNNIGIASPGYSCKIIPIKVGTDTPGIDGLFNSSEAITYAANLGADIINCSWGSFGYSPVNQTIIDYAVKEKKCFVVAAAGNESNNNDENPLFPAGYKGVFSVGAYDKMNKLSSFSNYGYSISSYAPGTDVYTLTADNNYFSGMNGTSFSSPYVAGVAGLVKSVHPNWTPKQIWHQLRSTSDRTIKVLGNKLHDFVFGTINAYKAVYFNNSGPALPGLSVENFKLKSESEVKSLKNYNSHLVEVNIKNYLGDAKNIKVLVSSPDYFVDCDTNLTISSLKSNEETKISFNVKLNDKNPWSVGNARVVLYYTAENYIDYKMIPISIDIPTNVITHFSINNNSNIGSYAGSSTPDSKSSFYLIEYPSLPEVYFLKKVDVKNKNVIDINYIQYLTSTICGLNDNTVYASAYKWLTGFSTILKFYFDDVTNKYNFTQYNVSHITNKLNNIYFKEDNENGIFLGNPIKGKWGIGYTNNKGVAWKAINYNLEAKSEEKGNPGASYQFGDEVWFASTVGKVYHSKDFGQNWNSYDAVNGNILHIAFTNSYNGMIFYNTSEGYPAIGISNDGGATWNNVNPSFPIFDQKPVKLFADRKSNSFVVVNNDGSIFQTYNNGYYWQPILKAKNHYVTNASAYFEDDNVYLSINGMNLEYVQYKSISADAKAELQFVQSGDYSFDSVAIKKSKVAKINVINSGELLAQIDDVKLEVIKGEAEEFKILSNFNSLSPGTEFTNLVLFKAISEGEKLAKLIISYKDNKNIEINLTGFAYKDEPKEEGELTVISGAKIDFGTVELNNSIEKVTKIINSTDNSITISSIQKEGNSDLDKEIEVLTELPVNLSKEQELNIVFKFTGKEIGKKFGTIGIYHNSSGSPIKLEYTAEVTKETKVPEINIKDRIIPNPANNEITINRNNNEKIYFIEIYGQIGNLVIRKDVSNIENNISLDISSLPQGTYNLILHKEKTIENIKLVILR